MQTYGRIEPAMEIMHILLAVLSSNLIGVERSPRAKLSDKSRMLADVMINSRSKVVKIQARHFPKCIIIYKFAVSRRWKRVCKLETKS